MILQVSFQICSDDNYFISHMKKEMYDTIDGKVLRCFQIVKKVGQGAYGQVWKAKNKKTGAICALKKIYEAFRNPSDAQKAYREIFYLQRLDHPSIIKLLNIHRPLSSKDIYLQLQFMEADLCIALKNSLLKQIHKHYIFYQLLNVVSYLHGAQLIHRDIKPSNILVNQTCEIKICDLGLIRSIKGDNNNETQVLTENIATRWYRAPEILLSCNNYGKAVDVWSVGCVLAEMIMQKPIFQGSSTISQLEKIFQVTGKPTMEDLPFLKNKASFKVIESMDIKEHKTVKQLLNTNDKQIVDLLQKIFQINPYKRPTASQLLNHPFIIKFRGKMDEKIPTSPIKILYETTLLTVDDYQKLIYGEVDPKDLKIAENPINNEELIYKTMPNHLSRNSIISHHFNKIERKSPLNLNIQATTKPSFSPLTLKKRDSKLKDGKDNNHDNSKDIKRERHSPSFLNNRKKPLQKQQDSKKDGPSDHSPTHSNIKIVKKWTFPLAYKSDSPQKRESPPKTPPKNIGHTTSLTNLWRNNPQKEVEKKLPTINQLKYSQSCNQTHQTQKFVKNLNTSVFQTDKSKEKKAPKFLTQNAEKKSTTPIKQKEAFNSILTNKNVLRTSPFSKSPINSKPIYNFRGIHGVYTGSLSPITQTISSVGQSIRLREAQGNQRTYIK